MITQEQNHAHVTQNPYLLLETLIQLFTLGIFSVEGGEKAWFELVLMSAALCASGYILWWQIPLLILAIILGTLAAGMFAILTPHYLESHDLQADKQIGKSLLSISEYHIENLSNLSASELELKWSQFRKAQQIFESNPRLVEQISQLQLTLDNINQAQFEATKKIEVERKKHAQQKKIRQDFINRQKAAEEERRKEAKERRYKQYKESQERQEREAKAKIARQKAELAWLREQRRREQFTGGCPPDNSYDPPRCRPGYPVKVTLNKKEDGFDGIIWKKSDAEYQNIRPKWCYRTVEEAETERGRYRFRRPKNNRGEPRP